ncbi:MAG: Geranylgeranylglyceryl phosphate synthase [Candidatus Heimdallarchaeota archaeon LC_3]|nr:MAG: Geranylgeranylglyceryl phosphate synthase [Candidatus Heimdallarchaeota archaeon LC_3]
MIIILNNTTNLLNKTKTDESEQNMFPRLPARPLRDIIYQKIQKHPLQSTLFDPENDLQILAHKAELAVEQGTDILLIGGSSHVQPIKFFESIAAIKAVSKDVPVIIYNANFEMISNDADGILYGSVLNSKDMYYVINNSANAAPLFKKLNVEPLATAFLIFEPGMTVGYVLNCHLLPQNNLKIPAAYSLTAENLGYSFVYLEAGSKAPYTVSPDVIKAVRSTINIPIIVGGGVVSEDKAREVVEAGADIVVIGTHFENVEDMSNIIDVIHSTKRFKPEK